MPKPIGATQAQETVRQLLREQRLCALSTDDQGNPYLSLVAFAAGDDIDFVLFATSRTSRKYGNLTAQSRVALLVDSRSNRDSDFEEAAAVTILGNAEELKEESRDPMAAIYLRKHPYLEDFLSSPDCALFKVTVEKCLLVTHFQNVTEVERQTQ